MLGEAAAAGEALASGCKVAGAAVAIPPAGAVAAVSALPEESQAVSPITPANITIPAIVLKVVIMLSSP
ncbi:hypothetical protein D3C74_388430 [compost metagenome]